MNIWFVKKHKETDQLGIFSTDYVDTLNVSKKTRHYANYVTVGARADYIDCVKLLLKRKADECTHTQNKGVT